MKLFTYTRKQLFSGVAFFGIVVLGLSLMAQPQTADNTQPVNSFTQHHPNTQLDVSKPGQKSSSKPTTADRTNKTDTASQSATTLSSSDNTIQVTKTKAMLALAPKPVLPRCNCPLPTDNANSPGICPNSCTAPAPSPLPPPHCAPCGGYLKTNSSQTIACPMYCME